MDPFVIPHSFIRDLFSPSWAEVAYGVDKGWLNIDGAIAIAVDRVTEADDPDLLELACSNPENRDRAMKLLRKLALRDESDTEISKSTWLRIVLRWLYDHRDQLADPLATVEELYADFGYPDEISSFVRYMPAKDSYRPQDHSRQENEERMMRLWHDYVTVTNQ